MDDWELLHAWSKDGSEPAFASLVERHAGLVHSAARRQVAGNAALAQEVTQRTFCLLATKAHSLPVHGSLAGWLYTTAGFVARECLRAERRRHDREALAAAARSFDVNPTPPPAEWEEIAQILDSAIHALSETDRQAILARFFEHRSMQGVGDVLGVNANAAKVRVARALTRLRQQLVRRGVSLPVAVLGGLLWDHSVEAAPAGVIAGTKAATASHALATGAAGATSAGILSLLTAMTTSHLKFTGITLVVALAAVVAGNRFLGTAYKQEGVLEGNQAPTAPANQAERVWATAADAPSQGMDALGKSYTSLAEARTNLLRAVTGDWPDRRLPQERIRLALRLFGRNGAAAVPVLLDCLRTPFGAGAVTTHAAAAFALQQLGVQGAAAVPELMVLFREGRLKLIANELDRLFPALQPEPSRMPEFIEFLASPVRGIGGDGACQVIAAYARLDAAALEAYRPPLEKLLDQDDPVIQRNASIALASFPGPPDDRVLRVMTDALELGRLRDPAAYEPVRRGSDTILRDSLRLDDQLWRSATVRALATIGTSAMPAIPWLEELSRLLPVSDPLRLEVLAAIGQIDPHRRQADAEIERVLTERERGTDLRARAESRTASPLELAEGLGNPLSAMACADALLESAPSSGNVDPRILQSSLQALQLGVGDGYPAARVLKELAPDQLVAFLRQGPVSPQTLVAVATALADLGARHREAAPYLEAAFDEVPSTDPGAIAAVADAIARLDPNHRKLVYGADEIRPATTALVEAIYASQKTGSPVYDTYIRQMQDLNAVTRKRLLAFAEATRTDPDLHRIFVSRLIGANPELAADLKISAIAGERAP